MLSIFFVESLNSLYTTFEDNIQKKNIIVTEYA